ncbi:MAG: PH domain-containing protein [Planctomycetia bacterium]|nr:PH domain-containing protein [Planctomycetia bacterium]
MQCSKCFADVVPEAVFCHHCGAQLPASKGFAGGAEPLADGPSMPFASPEAPTALPGSLGASGAATTGAAPTATGGQSRFGASGAGTAEDQERDQWQGTFSPRAMIPHAVAAAVLTLIVLIGAAFMKLSGAVWMWLLLAMVVGWIALAIRLWLRRMGVFYRLTTQRLFYEVGLLNRRINRIDVIDINDVTVDEGFIERMLGVGTVRIKSTDDSEPVLSLTGIENVRHVADLIDQNRRRERMRRGLHIDTS